VDPKGEPVRVRKRIENILDRMFFAFIRWRVNRMTKSITKLQRRLRVEGDPDSREKLASQLRRWEKEGEVLMDLLMEKM